MLLRVSESLFSSENSGKILMPEALFASHDIRNLNLQSLLARYPDWGACNTGIRRYF